MRISTVVRPKQPRNVKLTVAFLVLMLIVYWIGLYLGPWSPKRGLGLVFGIGATVLFVFEMAYPLRRPKAWILGTAKNWIQAHVYLGTIAFFAVLFHEDFAWPHGTMGFWLMALTAWATASGLLGVFIQKWLPAALSENLKVEALYERIPALVQELLAEADTLMEGTSEVLSRFYRNDARPLLAKLAPSWSFLLDLRGGRNER